MPTLEHNGATLHYHLVDATYPWIDSPETIVFHHGLGTTSATWAEWLPLLAGQYRLVAYDMRGCGRSSVPEPGFPWSYELLMDDLFAIADAVGADRFHFIGESLGGIIGYNLGIHRPERLLSIVSVTASHQAGWLRGGVADWQALIDQGGIKAWSEMMMEGRFPPDALSAEKSSWYHEHQMTSEPHVVLEVSGIIRQMDLRPHLHTIRTPLLLLIGEASPFVPVEAVIDIRQQIGQAASLHVISGARHGVVFSHPGECVNAVIGFIRRQG
ncbi:alpha/beta fold hydrolase [Futiania mangrovi]|uniref:Alpha/beta hydrolase n=1 Tax=Futiania mangrovi TaxID=2959716 RepID=A0A9J6PCS9_9PROT|nr:alpha/beta hydrolase [Futiania mangrovii]MCP1337157.1 alpha/beta hydrolase [Futiania mangrovii]